MQHNVRPRNVIEEQHPWGRRCQGDETRSKEEWRNDGSKRIDQSDYFIVCAQITNRRHVLTCQKTSDGVGSRPFSNLWVAGKLAAKNGLSKATKKTATGYGMPYVWGPAIFGVHGFVVRNYSLKKNIFTWNTTEFCAETCSDIELFQKRGFQKINFCIVFGFLKTRVSP